VLSFVLSVVKICGKIFYSFICENSESTLGKQYVVWLGDVLKEKEWVVAKPPRFFRMNRSFEINSRSWTKLFVHIWFD